MPLIDWTSLLFGLAGVVLLAVAARRVARGIARHTRVRAVTLSALLVAAAAAVALLPNLVRAVDESAVRSHYDATLNEAEAAATACLDLDTGDRDARADRLLALFRDGQVHIHPHYDFTFVPLTPEAAAGPRVRDRPARAPLRGPSRAGRDAPLPACGEAGSAAAAPRPRRGRSEHAARPRPGRGRDRPRVQRGRAFDDGRAGPGRRAAAPRHGGAQGRGDAGARRVQPAPFRGARGRRTLRRRRGRALARGAARRAHAGRGTDRRLARPTAVASARGPPRERGVDSAGGLRASRLARARRERAFPNTPFDAEVATVRVHYADGGATADLTLRNGRDLESRLLAYARAAADPESIALQWEDSVRQPVLYTLHPVGLDPSRRLERLEVIDAGVLGSLTVAAVTVGKRALEAPARGSGLKLSGQPAVRARRRARGVGRPRVRRPLPHGLDRTHRAPGRRPRAVRARVRGGRRRCPGDAHAARPARDRIPRERVARVRRRRAAARVRGGRRRREDAPARAPPAPQDADRPRRGDGGAAALPRRLPDAHPQRTGRGRSSR